MRLKDFNFHLPEGLIAIEPEAKRDDSRLLILQRDGTIEHKRFSNITDYLASGDLLILNNTRVLHARIEAHKPTGGRLDMLLVREVSEGRWEILCHKKYIGDVTIGAGIPARIEEGRHLVFSCPREEVFKTGQMPLPPYIKRRPNEMDKERYQTVYAKIDGSIAAPTAGLHFTKELIEGLKEKGVLVRYLTLHVGKGTFIPVRADYIKDHRMEPEYFEIPEGLISEINEAKARGNNKVVSTGTTVTRAIEGALTLNNGSATLKGATNIFIYPGYKFKAVDSLLTNFHLPCSTPLLLASAMAGRERLLTAYKSAIDMGYRFFSYGDAMLIL